MLSLDLSSKFPQINLNMREFSDRCVYEFENFRLDADSLLLFRGGEQLTLTPKVVATLLALVERHGEVVSKDGLMETVWPDTQVEEGNLTQNLYILRRTLGTFANGKPFIETLRRRGYRFNGEVALLNEAKGSTFKSYISNTGVQNRVSADAPKTIISNETGRRVERSGNVLALADWRVNEDEVAPSPLPERESEAQLETASGSKWKSRTAIIAAAAILLATLPVVWFQFVSKSKTSTMKGDLTFLNLTNGELADHATISPDGNYFVYVSHDGEMSHLWLQQTEQTARVEIIPPFSGAVYGTTFTPDSQFVYFAVNENGGDLNVLYRVPTLGGVKTKILTDVAAPVSFSPDGSEMAFMRGNKETNQSSLVIAASDGTRERILLTGNVGEAFFGGGAWSPDGKIIAYGRVNLKKSWEGGCSIVGTDPQSGETKELSPEKWDTCYRMAWTRDGQGLVFLGTKSKEAFSTRRDQVYYLSIADGEARRITTDGSRHQYASLGVTDADEILAVPFNRLSQIWAMDAGGDSLTAVQITKGFADGRAGIAPLADKRVAYLTRNNDGFSIWVMNADGTDRKQLTTDPPAIEELRAAPDGRFFVFAAQHDGWKHIYRIDSDGANLKQLTFGESLETDSTVSPDGNWIVYDSTVVEDKLRKTTLWKISTDGGDAVRLGDVDCQTPHFSPDGKFVSCVSADWKKISVISAQDGRELKTFETDGNPILNIGSRWTPDGKALAYVVFHKNVGNLWLQPINGNPPRPLTNFTSGDIYNFAFSVDDSLLYLARGYSIRNAILIRNFR